MHEKNVRSSPHGSYPATAVIIQGATIRALKKKSAYICGRKQQIISSYQQGNELLSNQTRKPNK
jgi:hypothetical protein